MSYSGTIEYLYGLQKHGMKFGLDNIKRLMSALGNPERSFRSVHVAGTNGKGSTSAIIESVLRTSGMRTGIFSSPHLVSFTERIKIDGEEIGEKDVIELAAEVRSVADRLEAFHPTFFEVVTAMAFLQFRKMNTEWAVIEVGMGGRLDATNVIIPEASVITTVSLDHCEFLGHTEEEIANEKAGIIKDHVPVITAEQTPKVMDVIARKAAGKQSPLFRYNSEFSAHIVSEDPEKIIFDYSGGGKYTRLNPGLQGEHQMANAAVAVKTVEVIMDQYPATVFDIRTGVGNARLPGRIEMIRDDPPVLIDGAHNPSAVNALSVYLKRILSSKYGRIILVAGIMKDKDIDGILRPLLPLASEIIFTSPAYGRAAPPELLAARAGSLGYFSRQARKMSEALNLAENLFMPGDLIVVTGSFYTTGEAKEALGHRGIFARLRE